MVFAKNKLLNLLVLAFAMTLGVSTALTAGEAGKSCAGELERWDAGEQLDRIANSPRVRAGQTRLQPWDPDVKAVDVSEAPVNQRGSDEFDDILTLSRDDTTRQFQWGPESDRQFESYIVPDGTSQRRAAFRYETEYFVRQYPVTVIGAEIIVDNGFGQVVWPNVSIYGEDLNTFFKPDLARRLGDGGAIDADDDDAVD